MVDSFFSRMRRVQANLGRVIAAREDEFLELGSTLHAFASRADNLVDMARELVESTVGEILKEVVRQLDDKMETMRSMCQVSDTAEMDEFGRIRGFLADLLSLLENYGRIVRTLQMLAISTRIESARLGADGRGFNTLADDVEKLGLKIAEYSAHIREQAARLDALSVDADGRMTSIRSSQQECSLNVFVMVQENVTSLQRYGTSLDAVSDSLTGTIAEIQNSMGEIVSSMQFHDIVRQQVEHVEEALGETADYLQAHTDELDAGDMAHWLGQVNTMQVAQLEYAETSFSQAVQVLRDGLQALGLHVRDVQQVVETARQGEDGSAPLDSISETVLHVSAHFRQLAEQGGDVGNVMVAVADTVSEMTSFLDDIEDVGAEIELIALNASIKAAHTGDMGKALGVLALSIQTLSHDARQQTDSIAEKLRSIAGAADVLRDMSRGYLDSSQADAMTAELQGFMEQLRTVQGRADSLLGSVDNEAVTLAEELDALASGIRVDEPVRAALQQAAGELMQIAETCTQEGNEEGAPLPDVLQAILDRYTMESERAIHRSHLVGDGEGDAELFGDDLDDNIELF